MRRPALQVCHLLRHLRKPDYNRSIQGASFLHKGDAPFSLMVQMQETPEQKQLLPEPEQLSTRDFISELIQGLGKMAGLGLLWALEEVRNVYFRALDRMKVKARPKSASAFPPGSPKRQRTV